MSDGAWCDGGAKASEGERRRAKIQSSIADEAAGWVWFRVNWKLLDGENEGCVGGDGRGAKSQARFQADQQPKQGSSRRKRAKSRELGRAAVAAAALVPVPVPGRRRLPRQERGSQAGTQNRETGSAPKPESGEGGYCAEENRADTESSSKEEGYCAEKPSLLRRRAKAMLGWAGDKRSDTSRC